MGIVSIAVDLNVDDDAFIRAPVALVYGHLADPARYVAWWPGFVPRPTAPRFGLSQVGKDALDEVVFTLRGRGPSLRMGFRAHSFRPNAGLHLDLGGDILGRAEWWLEEGFGGTVIHHLVWAAAERRPLTLLAAYRASLRRALWSLKDQLQSQVRTGAGLAP